MDILLLVTVVWCGVVCMLLYSLSHDTDFMQPSSVKKPESTL